ncbi:MAG: toprim domain-containing protein, partial [Pseudomonadota bacterium]
MRLNKCNADWCKRNGGVGDHPRTLPYRLPPKNRKAGKAIRDQLERLGVLKPTGHERFRGSIVVPLFDASGRVVQLYGRKVGRNLRKGTAAHVWLPGERRGVFNLAALRSQREVVVAGSIVDALTYWSAGFRNVTAADGPNGASRALLETLAAAGTKRVWVAYRRDRAGDEAAARVAEALTASGVEVFRVRYPRGLDANDVVRSANDPEKALGAHLRDAEWVGKGAAVPRSGKKPKRAGDAQG